MPTDLRGSDVARVLEQYTDGLAQGNEGDSTIEVLELEGTVLRFEVNVRHRHVQRIRIPLNGTRTIVVYDVTTPIRGKVDLKNPDPNDVEACVDTLVGRMCWTLRELIPIIVQTLGL